MINPDALKAGPYLDGKPWWATMRMVGLPCMLQKLYNSAHKKRQHIDVPPLCYVLWYPAKTPG
jgi:hypothetical protein